MANNLNDKLDQQQVIKSVYDTDDNSLRVSVVSGSGGGGSLAVEIDASEDSIAIGDGTKLATITTVGPKNALDVNVVQITGDIATETTLSDLNSKVIKSDTDNVTIINSVLPDGASTAFNQVTTNTTLSSILSELQQKTEPTDTQQISATSLPLPTGASTSALQSTGNASLASIDAKLTSPISVTGPLTNSELRASEVPVSLTSTTISNFPAVQSIDDNGGSLTVDGTVELGATSLAALENITATVSGPVDLSASTLAALENVSIDNFPVNQDVTVTSSVLPTGAATSALQTSGNSLLSDIDASLTTLISTDFSTEAKQDTIIVGLTDLLTELELKADLTETQPVSVSSLPLPTGASTSALQTAGNLSLSSIDTKLTSPLTVQATDLDVRNLTFAQDKIDASGSSVSITGSVAVTGPLTDTQLRASPVPVNGTVNVGNFPVVQPVNDNGGSLTVDGTVELGATTLAALESITVQNGAGVSAVNIQDGGNSITVDGSISVNNFPASQDVVVTSSVLPTGAATETTLSTLNGKFNTLGQKTMANSAPVVLASNQSAIPVTGPLTDTQLRATPVPVSGTVTANLGTIAGVATETTLSALNTKVPANLTVTATRLLVDGSGVTQPISATSLPLPTGAATSANQATANASLASIDAGIPAALGQTTMSASMPVTIASNQTNININNFDGAGNALISQTTYPTNTTRGLITRNIPYYLPTFTVISPSTVLGNNKSMISIQNTSSSIIRIKKIYLTNTQTTNVTGVVVDFRLLRIASFTGGTNLTIYSNDTQDILPAGITAATNSTVASESALFRQSFFSSDEWGPGTLDGEQYDHGIQEYQPWYKAEPDEKPITLIQNQGIHIRCATNTTAGRFTITVVFTVE